MNYMAYSERQMKQTTVTTKTESVSVFCGAVATERNGYHGSAYTEGTGGTPENLESKSDAALEVAADSGHEAGWASSIQLGNGHGQVERRSEVNDMVAFIEQGLACLEGEIELSDSIGRRLLQSQLNAALESAQTLAAHERDLRLAFEANSMEMTSNLRSASIKH